MFIRYLLITSLILLLPACFYRKPQAVGFSFKEPTIDEMRSGISDKDMGSDKLKNTAAKSQTKSTIDTQIKHYEAKYGDIAIPLGAKPIERYFTASDSGLTLAYSSQQSRAEITKFYERSMEQAGWLKQALFRGSVETLLIFEKKHRICAISIRDAGRGTQILLTIAQKEEDYS